MRKHLNPKFAISFFHTLETFNTANTFLIAIILHSMLRLLFKELESKEEYFKLAMRTECEIKLPVLDDFVIYFDGNSSIDDEWRFWLDNGGLIIFIGTIEQIKNAEGAHESNNILEELLIKITNNLGSIAKQLKTRLPKQLYNHILTWEDKITFENDTSIVDIGPNAHISFRKAKNKLSSHYQLLMDFKEHEDCTLNKNSSLVTLIQYKHPSGDNGRVSFNRDRNSFMTIINDNCIDETETAILHIIIQKVERQHFLTVGQLGVLKFLKNYASGYKLLV
jgi:hypothetical protein